METATNQSAGQEFILVEPASERDHSLGPLAAPITIVEYGDYECPTCFNAVPIIEQVRQRLGDWLRFVFRHFPQSSIHPRASAAAEAAEAAAEQGKFWQMHLALFKHQKELSDIDLDHLALTLGLEIYKFESSRSSEKHRYRVRSDYDGGVRAGVHKTPTLFINGRLYDGKLDAEAIVASAEAAMAEETAKGSTVLTRAARR